MKLALAIAATAVWSVWAVFALALCRAASRPTPTPPPRQPAPHPEIVPLLDEFARRAEIARLERHYRLDHPAYSGDDCPPRGIPRPRLPRHPRED